jgi:hypothetical protein
LKCPECEKEVRAVLRFGGIECCASCYETLEAECKEASRELAEGAKQALEEAANTPESRRDIELHNKWDGKRKNQRRKLLNLAKFVHG